MDIINVIYDNRVDDHERLLMEFRRQGITRYEFWDAIVDSKSVVASINASHKRIVRWAKVMELPRVVIAEQDVFFPSEKGWQYFMQQMPERFDIYSAATYVQDLEDKNILCGFHLYAVGAKFYDTFLAIPEHLHIDTAVSDLKGDFHVCRPFAALQRPGYSANNRAVVDYNKSLTPEDIYGAIHHLQGK